MYLTPLFQSTSKHVEFERLFGMLEYNDCNVQQNQAMFTRLSVLYVCLSAYLSIKLPNGKTSVNNDNGRPQ